MSSSSSPCCPLFGHGQTNLIKSDDFCSVAYHHVILKIRPMLYFHDGHHKSIQMNSKTLPRKNWVLGGKLYVPRLYTGLFSQPYFVRHLQICTTVTEKPVTCKSNLMGWPVDWIAEEKIVMYAASWPTKFQHPDQLLHCQQGAFPHAAPGWWDHSCAIVAGGMRLLGSKGASVGNYKLPLS